MAARFLVAGGNSNWNDTSNWASLSGGASGASFPVAGDTVAMDSGSGSAGIVVNVASACASLIMSGSYTGTLTFNSTLTLTSTCTFVAGCTIAGTTGTLILGGLSSTWTSGGKTLTCGLTVGSSQTYTLADNWVVNGLFTQGVLGGPAINGVGKTLTCNGGFHGTSGSGLTGSAKLVLAGGTWDNTAGGATAMDVDFAGNVTVSGTVAWGASGKTLKYVSGTITTTGSTLTCNTASTLDTNGVTWNNITLGSAVTYTVSSNLAWSGTLTINQVVTFAGVGQLNGAGAVTFGASGTTITFNNTGGLVTTGTLTLPNVNQTFSGSAGFTVGTLTTATLTVSRIHTLTFGNTYTVTNAFNNVGTTAAIRQALKSSSAGNRVVFNVNPGATTSLNFCDPTDVDSSGGRAVFSSGGTFTNSLNWISQYTGSLSATLGALTLSSAGQVASTNLTGSLSQTLGVLTLSAAGSAPVNLLPNLIGYWKLDEASGDALDSHGTNPLTEIGTVGTAAGKINTAREFPGSGANFFRHASNPDLVTGDVDFTVAAWVYINAKGVVGILGKYNGFGTGEYTLRLQDDRFKWFNMTTGGSYYELAANNLGSPALATWYHVIAWHDSVNDQMGIAVNAGTPDTLSAPGIIRDSMDAFEVGHSGDVGVWNGRIDEVGFWKRTLTADERTWLYNGGAGRSYSDFGTPPVTSTGSLSQTLGLLSINATGTVAVSGGLAVTLGQLTLTATGAVTTLLDLSQTLGLLTLDASGVLGAAQPTRHLVVSGNVATYFVATADVDTYFVVPGGIAMAGKGYAEFYQGESVSIEIRLEDRDDNAGWTTGAYLKQGSTTKLTTTPASNTPDVGSLLVSLTAAATEDLLTGTYTLEVWRTDAGAEALLSISSVVVKAV